MSLSVGSLFTGIGGLDLGLERAGMVVRWQSEIDPYCRRVLGKHWPDVPNLGDVTTIDWSAVEHVDVICGGYPCQPFSLAGVRRGEADPRHLWPHFANALRHIRPGWALLENVPGHLSIGFDRVLGDLADLGFDAEWHSVPAAAVGAPHLRYRVFVVAHTDSVELRDNRGSGPPEPQRCDVSAVAQHDGPPRDVADAEGVPVGTGLRAHQPPSQWWRRPGDSRGPVDAWPAEPGVGRVADGVPYRMDRLRALGNAVVPAVAEYVGRQIMAVAA